MIIQRQEDSILIGWADSDIFTGDLDIQLFCNGEPERHWGIDQITLQNKINNQQYFQIDVKSTACAIDIVSGLSTLLIKGKDGKDLTAKIFEPLKETLKVRALNANLLGSTFKLSPPELKLSIRRAVDYGTNTFPKSKIHKKTACVIAYANDSGGWFDAFLKHYSEQLGDSRLIYIVTPNPDSFFGRNLGGVVGMPGFEYDDCARSKALSGFLAGLSAYFEWVIVADVDELIFADHCNGIGSISIVERLSQCTTETVFFSLGMDVIQAPHEESFDFKKGLLEQRKYAIPNSGMCKPNISRGTVCLDIGSHYCQYPPKLSEPNSGFVMLHLKYACQRVMLEVAKIVAATGYADDVIRDYAFSSVGVRKNHPGMVTASIEKSIHLQNWDRAAFQQRIAAHSIYDGNRDLYIGKNFTLDFLVDFS